MKIEGNAFVVTGGASGLGEATVRTLVQAGGQVVIADVNRDAGEALTGELGKATRFVATDVSSEVDGRAAVSLAVSEFGALRGLINCAGIGPAEKVLGKKGPHDLANFNRCIQINLIGTFNMLRLAAEAMVESDPLPNGERGAIISTASVAAFEGQIGQVAYSASKGGVVAMTLPVARELARSGIRVMTIAPGLFETPMMAGLPQEVQVALGKAVPFPSRLGRPSEYAALVQHILENEMLNGEVIRLDGAIRLAPK
ncbi:MAG: 3-hydroxyacyl-CoA dehydrogenase [Gammaproteobacteria bacterium]|nr:3-hydroxyacyl-CoA dehydrogenase [Gammaproteobacteria bacterium]MCP5458265.1 3-hydroxyacyl-CoA dehydrogenase [Gammaproteobacteria bacterium]